MELFLRRFLKAWHPQIRTKLATLITLLIGAIALFISLYFPARLEEQALGAAVDKAQSITEMTAFIISSTLYFEDPDAVEESLKGTKQDKDLVYIVVLNHSGQVFTAFRKDIADQTNFNQATNNSHISQDGTIYKTMAPILHKGREIGQLYLGLSLKEVRANIERSRKHQNNS